jgi:hypothetical protein
VDAPVTANSTASDRMRASRERRRRGSVLVEIEVDARLLDQLIGLQMLNADQRTDRAAVGVAVLTFIRAESGPVGPSALAFVGILVEAIKQRREAAWQ